MMRLPTSVVVALLLALVLSSIAPSLPAPFAQGTIVLAQEVEEAPPPAPAETETVPPPQEEPLPLIGYDVPLGHFFPLNLTVNPDYGFTVDDGGGVRFWSEYLRLDGLSTLGYPASRRYLWNDAVVQHFERGVLRWIPQLGQAEIVPLGDVGTPAADWVRLESPPIVEGGMETPAWSGWWWPATDSVRPPHLFDFDGPLAKYDSYVSARTGSNPGTLAWERANMYLPDGPSWAGHCNGWAAAAVYEPEPTAPVIVGGEYFSVSDQKGLLADYHFADTAAWLYGGNYGDLQAVDFHFQLTLWMLRQSKGMVVVFNPGGQEIWSYPAYRVHLEYGSDAFEPGITHVNATLWIADNSVPAQFVGTQTYEGPGGKLFQYRLYGDRDAPSGAAWEGVSLGGAFSQPGQIWYPTTEIRNYERQLTAPALDYTFIKEIINGGPQEEPQPQEEQPAPPADDVQEPAPTVPDEAGADGTEPAGEQPAEGEATAPAEGEAAPPADGPLQPMLSIPVEHLRGGELTAP